MHVTCNFIGYIAGTREFRIRKRFAGEASGFRSYHQCAAACQCRSQLLPLS